MSVPRQQPHALRKAKQQFGQAKLLAEPRFIKIALADETALRAGWQSWRPWCFLA